MDALLDTIRLHVFLSLPQGYFSFLLVFSFLRPLPHKLLTRLFVLVLIHAIITDIFVLYIPAYLTAFNSMGSLLVLLMLLFKDLELRKRIFVYIGSVVLFILSDTLSVTIVMSMGAPELEAIRTDYLPEYVSVVYPQLLLFTLVGWFVRRRESTPTVNSLLTNLHEKKPFLRIFALIISQFVLIGLVFGVQHSFDDNKRIVTTILIYLTIVVSLSAIVYMTRMLTLERSEAIRSTQALYVDDINDMFTSIRGQRHDFLNHVQVIHTLVQMGKYEQLREYTVNLVQATREVSDIISSDAPALAAFAQAKTTVALGHGIAFTCELPDQWKIPDSAVSMLDMIKILGNLVDNAFDETNLLPAGERAVSVVIRTEAAAITMEVSNRGRPIDEETRINMFHGGYSTKGEGHSGLGLAIVQERVRYYGGTLAVASDSASGSTKFNVRLPFVIRSLADESAS